MSTKRLPTYFIGHGGVGILFREGSAPIQRNLHDLGQEIKTLKPDAIVVTSGHFQSGDDTIEVNLKEPTNVWHDFSIDWHSTFPHVYDYDYIHKASATLGKAVLEHLQNQGVKVRGVERDLDHGVWVPFKLMFPEEGPLDVPIVEVSTYNHDNLEAHIQLGKALRSLPGRILLVHSGMLVHNLSAFRDDQKVATYAKDVEEAALESLASAAEERKSKLLALQKRADWKLAHPTDDHILPLYVALGAGEHEKDCKIWGEGLYGVGMSYVSFRLGTVA